MKTILLSFVLLSLTSFSACNRIESDTIQPVNSGSLIGKWKLSAPTTAYTISLDIAQKSTEGNVIVYQFSGLSPVNQYGTDATLQQNGAVAIGPVIATKRGGEPGAMAAETAYFNSLQQVDKLELVNNKLQLRSRDTNWSLLVYDRQ